MLWRQVVSSSPLDPTEAKDPAAPYRSGIARVDALVDSGLSLSGNERNCAFLNTGSGRFATASASLGLDFKDDARALATLDWDGDGDLDVWTTNRTAPMLRFARNDLPSNNKSLAVKLVATSGNLDAIGATVTVTQAGGAKHVRELTAGSGFLTGNTRWLHFGLGDGASVSSLVVRWPSGSAETFKGASSGSRWLLRQSSGVATQDKPRAKVAVAADALELPDDDGSVAALAGSRPFIPRLPYHSLDGTPQHVGGPSDAITLVNLWATWCAPCVAELLAFKASEKSLNAAGVRVLPLAVDGLVEGGEGGNPAVFYQELGPTFPAGTATPELMRRVNEARSAAWGVRWDLPVPSSVLLDRQGRMLALYAGPVDVDRILEEAANAELEPIPFHDNALPFGGKWLERPQRLSPLPAAIELMKRGQVVDAHEFATRCGDTISRHPEYGRLMTWIGGELVKSGAAADGIAALEAGVEAAPDDIAALNNLAWQLAAHPDPSARDGARAVKWAERARDLTRGQNAAVLDTLAAAYAQNGEFEKAVSTAERAATLARASGNESLQKALQTASERYREGLPPAGG